VRQPKITRQDRLANDIALYTQQVGRKAQRGADPNDRKHDQELESRLKRMSPLDIDQLTRADNDEPDGSD
jgi:hypothetical protein